MKKHIAPKARKENLVVQESEGEVLIFDLDKNKAFCLNETSTLVWQLCDGNNSVSEISDSISRKLNSPVNEDFVWLALDQLKKEKLIANGEEIVADFTGMSRREVVRKIGLGTMISLPIVASLVAPKAAFAGSTCGSSCMTSADCTGPTCMTCQVGGQGNNTCV
jgi:hypothetical protein